MLPKTRDQKWWIRHVTNLINNCCLKKVKKGDGNSHKGKNVADKFWKLYTFCNHTNFTSCFNKNCKLRSQVPFLWKFIISLTKMLTLTENLALLGERIQFSPVPTLTDIILRSLLSFERTIDLILLKKECPWFFKNIVVLEVFWKIRRPGSVSRFFLYCKYLKSCNFCRSRKKMLDICIWVFVFRIIRKLLSFEFPKKNN